MKIASFGQTDIGLKRKINQDAFHIDEDLRFFIVADGMGGRSAGEVAAQESVEIVYDMIVGQKQVVLDFLNNVSPEENMKKVLRLLESAIQSATYMVFGMAEQRPDYHGMGTTVSALILADDCAVTAQVGDSRIYRIRDNVPIQLTEDHTLVNWQIKEGMITPEEAKHVRHKNVITRAVGNKDYVQVDTQVISVVSDDRFLLCSDGLHGYLKTREIPAINSYSPEESCNLLIRLANERGGKDNITVVIVDIN